MWIIGNISTLTSPSVSGSGHHRHHPDQNHGCSGWDWHAGHQGWVPQDVRQDSLFLHQGEIHWPQEIDCWFIIERKWYTVCGHFFCWQEVKLNSLCCLGRHFWWLPQNPPAAVWRRVEWLWHHSAMTSPCQNMFGALPNFSAPHWPLHFRDQSWCLFFAVCYTN